MSVTYEATPLPRNDVRRVYNTIAHSSEKLTLEQVIALCPWYSAGQVYWACGTLTRQVIIKPCGCARSDGKPTNPHFDVLLPFDPNYIGWEDAK